MGKNDKLNKRIQFLASETILYQLNDPRIKFITVLKAKLTDDMRYCTIYISILGTDAEKRTTMRALEHARGYIQKQIAANISTRYAPVIKFSQDDGIEKSQRITEILAKALDKDEKEEPEKS